MTRYLCAALLSAILSTPAGARVDTLRGVAEVEDATIYAYPDCNPDEFGEDCRRYNSGGCQTLRVGHAFISNHRTVMRFLGWDGVMPDSSILELYCEGESDTLDRRLFAYPLTRRFIEGRESIYGVGGIPTTDSGVTWNHAWLIGNLDSLVWTTPGGDYRTAAACTMTVTGPGNYYRFPRFDRILAYWDAAGGDHGLLLVNENAFPVNNSMKTFTSSEGPPERSPRLLLYYPDNVVTVGRRRFQATAGLTR